MEFWDRIFVFAVVLAVPVVLVAVPIYLLAGGLQGFARKPLERRFAGLKINAIPQVGDVTVVYHTYRGALLWAMQDEHVIHANPEDARESLRRLLRFNLTWGMLSYGMILIPFLAIGNYRTQMDSIDRQLAERVKKTPPSQI